MVVDDLDFPGDRLYDPVEHVWVKIEAPDRVRIGLDALALRAAGEIVYVRAATVGTTIARGRPIASIEAAKFVGPVRSPLTGMVVEAAADARAGWLVVLAPAKLEEERGRLVGGEDVAEWAAREIAAYRAKGWLPRA